MHMNRKRKILTVVALVLFALIILGHRTVSHSTEGYMAGGEYVPGKTHMVIDDVRMPLLVLAVFYTGLFLRLGDKKRDNSG
jgi:hypothetical protein